MYGWMTGRKAWNVRLFFSEYGWFVLLGIGGLIFWWVVGSHTLGNVASIPDSTPIGQMTWGQAKPLLGYVLLVWLCTRK